MLHVQNVGGPNLGLLQSTDVNELGTMLNTLADGCATVYRRGGDGYSVYAMLKALVAHHAVY